MTTITDASAAELAAELAADLAALNRMTAAQLRERYAEVFGEPAWSNNRRWLHRRVAWRLQELACGGLSERARARAAELARDTDLRVRPPRDFDPASAPVEPAGPGKGRGDRDGGPRPPRLFAVSGTLDPRASAGDRRLPPVGSVLLREYRGSLHRVTVLEGGFEHAGQTYRSLSAVAAAITGSHWNGFKFFNLTRSA